MSEPDLVTFALQHAHPSGASREWVEAQARRYMRQALTERGQWPVECVDRWTEVAGQPVFRIWTRVPRHPTDTYGGQVG